MSARPTIGERCRRFTLQLPVETPDGFGGAVRTYQPGPQVWGSIRLVSGEERSRTDRPESAVSHRVAMAFRTDVTGATRLTLGSRIFRVAAASDPDGRRRDLVCFVEEIRP